MTPEEQHRRVTNIFLHASARSGPDRAEFVTRACGGNVALRAGVEELLAADSGAAGFLDRPLISNTAGARMADALAGVLVESRPVLPDGTTVGRYRIERLIGMGGMGAVYEAVQDEPRRTVALKLMRAEGSSTSTARRFREESRTLARLRHPGIAQVYEAGVYRFDESSGNGDGGGLVPYFAMEYVPNATTIVEHCRSRKLKLREALELFAKACDAVQHGHVKGIVHCDLKPANILVSDDGPKVIDFGISRVLESADDAPAPAMTRGVILGTVQYMSPEQCGGDPQDVDSRSDVYSLGVVLFELLCGRPPYEVSHLPLPQAMRTVCEQEPPRSSTIRRELRGDVDAILQKSLAKEPAHRYESAGDLARDVRRHLACEPIEARRTSPAYALGKFLRRRWRGVSLAAAILAVIGSTAAFVLSQEAARERRASEADSAQWVSGLLRSIALVAQDQQTAAEIQEGVRGLLDEYAARVENDFQGRPFFQYRVGTAIAHAFLALGEHHKAGDQWLAAQRAAEQEFGAESEPVADAVFGYGNTLLSQGDYAGAELSYRQALDMRRRLPGDQEIVIGETLGAVAASLKGAGKLSEAEPLARESLIMLRRRCEELNGNPAVYIKGLAELLSDLGQYEESAGKYEEAVGKYEEAETLQREALGLAVGEHGPDHEKVSHHYHSLAVLLDRIERFEEAETMARRALDIRDHAYSEGKWGKRFRYVSMGLLGKVLGHQKRFEEGAPLLLKAIENYKPPPGVDLIKRERLEDIMKLYDAWDKAEPGVGHAQEAAECKAKLNEYDQAKVGP